MSVAFELFEVLFALDAFEELLVSDALELLSEALFPEKRFKKFFSFMIILISAHVFARNGVASSARRHKSRV